MTFSEANCFPVILSILLLIGSVGAQSDILRWCTTSAPEQQKCTDLSEALDKINFFGRAQSEKFKLSCVQAFSKAECMQFLDSNAVDITSMDPGDIYVGGRYSSLLPIMQEVSNGSLQGSFAVAVVKRGFLPDVTNLRHLKKKKACFGGVGLYGSWVIPVYTLMKDGIMPIADCNNHVKSANEFFGTSCAPNSLVDIYNPLGDNSDGLCKLCAGTIPGERCSSQDPYAGYQGAFQCLVEAGDIAFLKHTTVRSMIGNPKFAQVREDEFELLCTDGSRRSMLEFQQCNWGRIPNDAIMTSSARSIEERKKYQIYVEKLFELFATFGDASPASSTNQFGSSLNSVTESNFDLFESVPKYGSQHNLLFQDDTVAFRRILGGSQTYGGYLQEAVQPILDIRRCPVSTLRFCTTSEIAYGKCVQMKIAMRAQLLKPELVCIRAHSDIHCMKLIDSYDADVTMFDAGDVYTAGYKYNLIPILSEVYNLGEPEYYVVAVAKARDADTELIYLKGKNTCHTGLNHAAGWIIPMAHLLSNQQIRNYGCNSMQAAAEYFSKSCLPGALSREYAKSEMSYTHLCDLCHGSSYKFCRRDLAEDYFGHTGAFRCLVEGGGHVAFVKHTTVAENSDGKRREFWSRNQLSKDFELLCRDGQRAPVTDYRTCNLAKVKANALVARGGAKRNDTEINAYINLFMYAQQFYGLKSDQDFSLFVSEAPHTDVIFQDATQKLQVVPEDQRHYRPYLGKQFLRARAIVDCTAGSTGLTASLIMVVISAFVYKV